MILFTYFNLCPEIKIEFWWYRLKYHTFWCIFHRYFSFGEDDENRFYLQWAHTREMYSSFILFSVSWNIQFSTKSVFIGIFETLLVTVQMPFEMYVGIRISMVKHEEDERTKKIYIYKKLSFYFVFNVTSLCSLNLDLNSFVCFTRLLILKKSTVWNLLQKLNLHVPFSTHTQIIKVFCASYKSFTDHGNLFNSYDCAVMLSSSVLHWLKLVGDYFFLLWWCCYLEMDTTKHDKSCTPKPKLFYQFIAKI